MRPLAGPPGGSGSRARPSLVRPEQRGAVVLKARTARHCQRQRRVSRYAAAVADSLREVNEGRVAGGSAALPAAAGLSPFCSIA